MVKKFSSLFLVIFLCIGFVGCKKIENKEEINKDDQKQEQVINKKENKSSEEEFDYLNDMILSSGHPRLFDNEKIIPSYVNQFPSDTIYAYYSDGVIGDSNYGTNVMSLINQDNDNLIEIIELKLDVFSIHQVIEILESYLPSESVMKYYDGPYYIKYYDEDGFVQYRIKYELSKKTRDLIKEDGEFPYKKDIYMIIQPSNDDHDYIAEVTCDLSGQNLDLEKIHETTWNPRELD